ncbi:hypothetical protein P152DRAFT_458949 [Eremomyces bilateralis CBS 781.70]|uniref:Swi5-domain-containing protein n=1 Tax=Eremomyces bilateralis CBS 781.70 TaxID=1392243 RepID=A0A6G1G1L0_9PEZI|nr:uncharacterized protein P152DRAFT_458949 [Eremomyces bilateralis CBS 781.70]KAF1811997.1 hypothetical protein P152DRAFT_458949 [Eremomyces bilateralis CBS 781.70]
MPGLNGPDAAQKISSLQSRIQALESNLPELLARREALISQVRQCPAIASQLPSEPTDATPTAPPKAEDPQNATATDLTAEATPADSEVIAAAKKINDQHIRKLHEYNEIRDVGLGLMGMIAEKRGTRVVEVQREFGIDTAD